MALDESTRRALLSLYDAPDREHPGAVIPGYDRDHAERATRMVLLVARALGLDQKWERDLEVACLLHDIGRAGMDPAFFSQVFSLAQQRGLPLRIRELRKAYPSVSEADATGFFMKLMEPHLKVEGIVIDARLLEHVRMRMDFKARVREALAKAKPQLDALGIDFQPWMEKVVLYYYYPQDMEGESSEVRLMGMALLACENLEAFNNSRRGRDYYGRQQERLREAFAALARFKDDGFVSAEVIACITQLAASGQLDEVIKESRGLAPSESLPTEDVALLKELASA